MTVSSIIGPGKIGFRKVKSKSQAPSFILKKKNSENVSKARVLRLLLKTGISLKGPGMLNTILNKTLIIQE